MARHHTTPSGNIPFTAKEEAARDAEETAYAAAKPMQDWLAEMQDSDNAGISRTIENIIDSMSDNQRSRLDKVTMDRHTAKKVIRARKP